ncbi:MAG TPA: SulP family inorganic anion transporter [Paracoccaceae bacterium]|nr:SulP family inorganic anion transporter [Paracoccaceae bacterium]
MRPEMLHTVRSYSRRLFMADLFAGITVAMVALPLSLAIAIASGARPIDGLVTAVVAGFLISALGGSKVQIGGPTGAFIVVVYGVIAAHGYDGLVIATFLAGLILLIAGFLRAGNLIEFVPEPVVNGFTIGIAAIIATSQIKDLFGLSIAEVPADFLEKLPVLWAARGSLNPAALLVGLVTIVLIVTLRRLLPRWPGLIVAVALTSGAVALFDLPVETIADRFGALPNSLPLPHFPELNVARFIELLPSAIIIAFLAGVESLLSAMVADRLHDSTHRPNAELMAQGYANLASSFFGGLPATGAIARTATNIRAGGQTPVAGIIHALTMLAFIYLAAPLVGYLAMPALAGLLMLTAWGMSEPHHWPHYLKLRLADKVLLILTMLLTLIVDLTVAIGVGVALGLAIRLRRRNVPPAEWETPDR